jgi:hypothetical protein
LRCVRADEFLMTLFPFSFLLFIKLVCAIGKKSAATEAERRFKSIREKYRRRKILLERDVSNNVEHSKLKRWDLYNKLAFLDDFMIPRK